MNAVIVDAANKEILVQGKLPIAQFAYKLASSPILMPMMFAGGAVYADILNATEPYNLALPWGDAEQTGAFILTFLL